MYAQGARKAQGPEPARASNAKYAQPIRRRKTGVLFFWLLHGAPLDSSFGRSWNVQHSNLLVNVRECAPSVLLVLAWSRSQMGASPNVALIILALGTTSRYCGVCHPEKERLAGTFLVAKGLLLFFTRTRASDKFMVHPEHVRARRAKFPCAGTSCRSVCVSVTEGGQPKIIIFWAILHILDVRGHNSTKAT